MKKIILASSSPRRKKILRKAGLKFAIVKSNVEENLNSNLSPRDLAKKLSLKKAKAVYENHKDSIIIAADTLVVCKGKILGKPKDQEDAREMLNLLSGNTHLVITGFAIINGNNVVTKSIETKIGMRKINDEEINAYIRTKEPYDKAGAYAIQGIAKKFIQKINGDFDNAVGLPTYALLKELKKLDIK